MISGSEEFTPLAGGHYTTVRVKRSERTSFVADLPLKV